MKRLTIPRFLREPQTGLILGTVLIPILAYIFYFVGFETGRNSFAFWVIILLGVVYLTLGLLVERFFVNPLQQKLSLALLLVLGLSINFLAEPGLLWIILLPLVGMGEGVLSRGGRLLLYMATLIGASGPYILSNGLWDGLVSAIFFFPAILFVVVFTRLMLTAERERDRAEVLAVELAEANRQLGQYAVQAEELATTQERNRIAREIHDTLGHYLTVVNVQLEAAKTIMAQKPEKALNAIDRAQNMTREGLNAIRQSVTSLREDPVGDRPLPDAIRPLIEENRAAGINTDFGVHADPRPLSPNAALTVYRVVQEGLTNIRKHADASHVAVALDFSAEDEITVSIRDDGIGADLSDGYDAGFGLLGIRERIHIIGGRMQVETDLGTGFQLRVILPG